MTNKVIIDYTQCKYNTFDGGGSQRTICSLDGKYCDCLRDKECYYKQLQRKTQECEKMKEENQKYKSALDEIEEFCLVYRDNPVEGSAYKKILDIITKAKEQE